MPIQYVGRALHLDGLFKLCAAAAANSPRAMAFVDALIIVPRAMPCPSATQQRGSGAEQKQSSHTAPSQRCKDQTSAGDCGNDPLVVADIHSQIFIDFSDLGGIGEGLVGQGHSDDFCSRFIASHRRFALIFLHVLFATVSNNQFSEATKGEAEDSCAIGLVQHPITFRNRLWSFSPFALFDCDSHSDLILRLLPEAALHALSLCMTRGDLGLIILLLDDGDPQFAISR
jgi:hypothetical protein